LHPTSLQELNISSREIDFLDQQTSHVLLSFFIKQPKETGLAVWVILQTKSKNKIED